MGWDGKFFGILLGPATTFFLNSAFPRLSWLPPFAVGLERRRGFNGASVIFHKLYMVRGGLRAIWRVFSAKLALRAAFFSRQDPAASAASNRRPSPAKMIRRRSRIALKWQFIRQFWIIIGKQSATGPESASSKVDPNLQPRWTSGRRIMVL